MMKIRTRKVIAAVVGLATMAAVGFALYLSFDPDKYFFYKPEDRASWVYQPGSVIFVCSVMMAEAAFLLMALIAPRPRSLWLRCLLGLIILGPWALVPTMFVLHMPWYTLFHHAWVWTLVIALVLVAASSGLRQLYLRTRFGAYPSGEIR